MKKVIFAVLAVLLVFSLAGAAAFSLAWYRSTNVFLGEDVYPLESATLDLRDKNITMEYYDALQAELPYCEIYWMVPFQGGLYPNTSRSLTVKSFTQEDARLAGKYFPFLSALDATGCTDYALLRQFQEDNPNCEVIYRVDLGAADYPLNTSTLDMTADQYTYDALMANLPYLTRVTSVILRQPDITLEQINTLSETYPDIDWSYTVNIMGVEYNGGITALDLSDVTGDDVEDVAKLLPLLPNLQNIELMDLNDKSALSKEEVKVLVNAVPHVKFHYTFYYFGIKMSIDSEEVVLVRRAIADKDEKDLRLILDLMPNCKRFVLDNCRLSDEVLARIRDDYRGRTKIVWRVSFGDRGSCLTDVEVIRSTHDHVEHNYKRLKYCEDVVHIDFGHNDNLPSCEFVAYMPNLESIILSGTSIKDLTPFENCKKLKFLEIAFCGYLTDLTPLAGCTSLEMLNIGGISGIKDLTPLDELPLTHFSARWTTGTSRIPAAEQARFKEKHPNCWTTFNGSQPYSTGWRYEEDQQTKLPYYDFLSRLYDLPNNNGINRTGYYLKDAQGRLN